jgi:hypothetical protein
MLLVSDHTIGGRWLVGCYFFLKSIHTQATIMISPQCLLTCHVSLNLNRKRKDVILYWLKRFLMWLFYICFFIYWLEAHSLSQSTITLKHRAQMTNISNWTRDGGAGGLYHPKVQCYQLWNICSLTFSIGFEAKMAWYRFLHLHAPLPSIPIDKY